MKINHESASSFFNLVDSPRLIYLINLKLYMYYWSAFLQLLEAVKMLTKYIVKIQSCTMQAVLASCCGVKLVVAVAFVLLSHS